MGTDVRSTKLNRAKNVRELPGIVEIIWLRTGEIMAETPEIDYKSLLEQLRKASLAFVSPKDSLYSLAADAIERLSTPCQSEEDEVENVAHLLTEEDWKRKEEALIGPGHWDEEFEMQRIEEQ